MSKAYRVVLQRPFLAKEIFRRCCSGRAAWNVTGHSATSASTSNRGKVKTIGDTQGVIELYLYPSAHEDRLAQQDADER